MFEALSSFTGGGGLTQSTSQSADGDNTFSNAFNYKTKAGGDSMQGAIVIGAVVLIGLFLIKGR